MNLDNKDPMSDNLKENSPDSSTTRDNISDDGSNGWRKGYIQGNTFSNKEVKYRIINGMAIFEGDIILASTPKGIERLSHKLVKGVGIRGEQYRWPRGEIPYMINIRLQNKNRVTEAIRHWESKTPIRFIQITDSNVQYYPNYVSFVQYILKPGEKQEEVFHCSSAIGMGNWGAQSVVISDQCNTGDVIHEIGHTVGLWHEQSRADRDDYVKPLLENVIDGIQLDGTYDRNKDMRPNFDQHVTDGDAIGPYDYCSIMHYGAWFFSKNGQQTLQVLQRNRPCGSEDQIGQKNGLSNGDISAVVQMNANIIPTVIRGPYGILEVFMVGLDGQLYSTGQNHQNDNRWGAYISENSGWVEGNWLPLTGGVSFGGPPLVWPVGNNPAVAQNADGRLEVFMVGSDGRLYHMFQRSLGEPGWAGSWYGSWVMSWYTLGGGRQWLGCDPAVAQNADGRLEVFIVGLDPNSLDNRHTERLYHIWQTAPNQKTASLGEWSADTVPPVQLGTQMIPGAKWSRRRRPSVAQNADGRLEVFMVGLDNQLWHMWQTSKNNSSQWSDSWVPLGGPLLGDPVIAQNADGRLEVFKVDANDNYLYHRWQTAPNSSSQWSDGWTPLGGPFPPRKRPAVSQNADGRLEVFMVGSDGRLYSITQTSKNNSSQWSTAVPFEGMQWPLSSNPAVAQNADGRLEVFMVGLDGQLWHIQQTAPNGGWVGGNWTPLGGQWTSIKD